jgi:D-alanyl-D-alanine endopeptidase (penicillin-binding protein 7)
MIATTLSDSSPMFAPASAKMVLAFSFTIGLFFCAHSYAAESQFSDIKGDPNLRSASVLITDANGAIIYGKDINTVRPIASLTKLMTAMVVLDAGLNLDEKITITKQDRDLIRLTGSRLEYGAKLSRKDLLHLALMSSENRAATALGRTYPGGMPKFVADMNRKALSLGMAESHFSDPAGLQSGNQATAVDLSKMLTAASHYPLITRATTTLRQQVRPYSSRGPLNYGNTNRLLKNKNWDIAVSKTGYLDEAGRCLLMQANIEGEAISIVLLNSFGKLTPFGDSNRLRQWMLSNS